MRWRKIDKKKIVMIHHDCVDQMVVIAVSYTHLDVNKRQVPDWSVIERFTNNCVNTTISVSVLFMVCM